MALYLSDIYFAYRPAGAFFSDAPRRRMEAPAPPAFDPSGSRSDKSLDVIPVNQAQLVFMAERIMFRDDAQPQFIFPADG